MLGGCADALLEAPYVLSTGLSEVRSVSASGRNTLIVGGEGGLWEVDGEGRHAPLAEGAVDALTVDPRRLYVLGGGRIQYGPIPAAGQPFLPTGSQAAPGVVDLQAWCDGTVLLGSSQEITAWNPDTGETSAFALGLDGLRALALGGGDGCGYALVTTATRLLAVTPTGVEVLAHDLVDARAATLDHAGRVWVVAGDPLTLDQVVSGEATIFARYVGDVHDLVPGFGGLLPPSNLYLGGADGTIGYVYVP